MPRMGGAALAEKLKVCHPEAKVILMTGYADYVPRAQGIQEPERPMLQKPFSRESLLDRGATFEPSDPGTRVASAS
jgi:FixJ family two-component response regulator